ncbi:MAG: NUDIX domain-containing protein [Actinomycetales bacterium]|nr:NUDIX domain-containing protein [Actinomycetales bacterium]MCP4894657.1 NUDIX domain-containing protein [Actinomycetales bacterium]
MTLQADARSALTAFSHQDPDQRALAQEYREFLDAHEDGVWRSCRVGHITASALVIEDQGRGVLLTLHPKVGRWLQLGGHLEPADASVLHGAVREVREESGIARGRISSVPVRLDRHDVPCGRDDDGRVLASVHWDMQFVVVVPNAIPPVISDESDDLAWFSSQSMPDVDASVQALCDDAVRALSSPQDRGLEPMWVSFG